MEGVGTGGDSPEEKAALSTPTGFPGPARFKAPQSHLTVPLKMSVAPRESWFHFRRERMEI